MRGGERANVTKMMTRLLRSDWLAETMVRLWGLGCATHACPKFLIKIGFVLNASVSLESFVSISMSFNSWYSCYEGEYPLVRS